jgi:hypothetical protein
LSGMDAQPSEPVLVGLAHVLGAGLDPRSEPAGCYIGRRDRDRLWRRRVPPAFKGVERSRRIAPRSS